MAGAPTDSGEMPGNVWKICILENESRHRIQRMRMSEIDLLGLSASPRDEQTKQCENDEMRQAGRRSAGCNALIGRLTANLSICDTVLGQTAIVL